MNPNEPEAKKPEYDLETIERLRKQAEKNGLNFTDKWNHIGNHFGVSKEAVRKWYYRALDKSDKKKKKITSDQWRTAYLVLTGENSRDTIATIKRKISHLLK